jgi:DMSO reductase family type II enzyme chaperone
VDNATFYLLMRDLLSFPSPGLAESVRDGSLARALQDARPDLEREPALAALSDSWLTDAALEALYIALFDGAGPARACPLYTGVFAPSRRDAMEELARFYRHFSVTSATDARDLPDAVPTVLEFLGLLAEGERAAAGSAQAAFRAARRDVLERHLLPWCREASARLRDAEFATLYSSAIALLERVVTGDLAALNTLCAPAASRYPRAQSFARKLPSPGRSRERGRG